MGKRLLFLSYASRDAEAAIRIAKRIESAPDARAHGLRVWIDKRDLIPGRPWQEQVETAIHEHSMAFAVLVTEAGANNWVRMEIRAALDRVIAAQRNGEGYPFIPILSENLADVQALPKFAQQYQGVHLASGDALQRIVTAALGEGIGAVVLTDEPFVNLEPFSAEESHLFFGREEQSEALVQRLRGKSLVMVVGDSGSGKSSLVRAGLVPAFRDGKLADPGSPRLDSSLWHVVEMRPFGEPFEALIKGVSDAARSVAVNANLLRSALMDVRKQRPGAIRDALREGSPKDAKVLLVIDQFEELWTLSNFEGCTFFLGELCDLTRNNDPALRVVMTMRRDYYNPDSAHKKFFARLEQDERRGVFNLRRMSGTCLRACIEKPLALAGASQAESKRLADVILRDAGDQPGDLALIEVALTETWRERHRHDADLLKSYESIGRVEGALRKAAEDVYRSLANTEMHRLEVLAVRLVNLGDTGGITRRVAREDEFSRLTWELAKKLGEKKHRRLLVLGSHPDGGGSVELAHELLASQWPLYRRCLRGTDKDPRAADKRLLDRLGGRVALWRTRGEAWRDVATGSERNEFHQLRKRRRSWFSTAERRFVTRSNQRFLCARIAVAALALLFAAVGIRLYLVQLDRAAKAEQLARSTKVAFIWNRFSLATPPTERPFPKDAVEALAELTAAAIEEKLAFLGEMLVQPSLAERFSLMPDIIARALVGLHLEHRQEIIDRVVNELPNVSDDRVAFAIGQLVPLLGAPELGEAVFARIAGASHIIYRADFSGLVRRMSETLSDDQARTIIPRWISLTKPSRRPRDLLTLSACLDGRRIAAPPLESLMERLLEAIDTSRTETSFDERLRRDLCAFLERLPSHVAHEHTESFRKRWIAEIDSSSGGYGLVALVKGLGEFVPMPMDIELDIASQLLATVENSNQSHSLFRIRHGLRALPNGIAILAPNDVVEQWFSAVVDQANAIQDSSHRSFSCLKFAVLLDGLEALGVTFTAQKLERLGALWLSAREMTQESELRHVGNIAAGLIRCVEPEQRSGVIDDWLKAIAFLKDPRLRRALGRPMTEPHVGLIGAEPKNLVASLLSDEGPHGSRVPAIRDLMRLVPRADSDHTAEFIDALLARLSNDPNEIAAALFGLLDLDIEISEAQLDRLSDLILDANAAAELRGDRNELYRPVHGLLRLRPNLDLGRRRSLADALLSSMKGLRKRWEIKAQSTALVELTPGARGGVVDAWLDVIERTPERRQLLSLLEGLIVSNLRLTSAQLDRVAGQVGSHATEAEVIGRLGQVIGMLTPAEMRSANDAVARWHDAIASYSETTKRHLGTVEATEIVEGITAIYADFADPQMPRAASWLLAEISGTESPKDLKVFLRGLKLVRTEVEGGRAAIVIEKALAAIQSADVSDGAPLVEDLIWLGQGALEGETDPIVDLWLTSAYSIDNSSTQAAVMNALVRSGIPIRVERDRIAHHLDRLRIQIKTTGLSTVAEGMGVIAAALIEGDPESLRGFLEGLVTDLESTNDSGEIGGLIYGVGAWSHGLTGNDLRRIFQRALAYIRSGGDGRGVPWIMSALASLQRKLVPSKADGVVGLCARLIDETTDHRVRRRLIYSVSALPLEARSELARQVTELWLDAIESTDTQYLLDAPLVRCQLIEGLLATRAELSPEHMPGVLKSWLTMLALVAGDERPWEPRSNVWGSVPLPTLLRVWDDFPIDLLSEQFAKLTDAEALIPVAKAVVQELERDVSHETVERTIALLKAPMSAGRCTLLLLEAFGRRFPTELPNPRTLWDLARFAEMEFPRIDLRRPPVSTP